MIRTAHATGWHRPERSTRRGSSGSKGSRSGSTHAFRHANRRIGRMRLSLAALVTVVTVVSSVPAVRLAAQQAKPARPAPVPPASLSVSVTNVATGAPVRAEVSIDRPAPSRPRRFARGTSRSATSPAGRVRLRAIAFGYEPADTVVVAQRRRGPHRRAPPSRCCRNRSRPCARSRSRRSAIRFEEQATPSVVSISGARSAPRSGASERPTSSDPWRCCPASLRATTSPPASTCAEGRPTRISCCSTASRSTTRSTSAVCSGRSLTRP